MSEITSHHLHNVYTPRGAQVRDALAWSRQIQESIERFGKRLEIQFACHHWPIWGRDRAVAYLEKQRDLYKYIHDQTLRLANHGYTKEEIAEQIRLPDALGLEFANRGYYGTVHHNARAVYVKYLGYFDGNPATLHALPPGEAGRRYLEYMGGADRVVERARESFADGDYRWVAEVLNHVVMAEPGHQAARALLADTLEQLGYQAESAPWRNFYLCGALELRDGLPETGTRFAASEGMARGMPIDNLFETMAVRLNGPRADGVRLALNLQFTDLDRTYLLSIDNAVLHAFPDRCADAPDAALTTTTLAFKRLMMGLTTATDLIGDGQLAVDGSLAALAGLADLFDQFERRFPIVTPRPAPPV
jgi:alkyl sulfatase BDS1-like metallo-beta-lactamase superfamily hydrolase